MSSTETFPLIWWKCLLSLASLLLILTSKFSFFCFLNSQQDGWYFKNLIRISSFTMGISNLAQLGVSDYVNTVIQWTLHTEIHLVFQLKSPTCWDCCHGISQNLVSWDRRHATKRDKPFVQSEVEHFNYWPHINELSLSLMNKPFWNIKADT